ncbi:sigma-70 family RNA polymerase sigma factor [Mangrovibacillus cuniculi]|uniref:Sigma-70 family RNA polymerase sigma factor n=1 Tax=Mangrovibacillus cuniculi TaxID=2593652 RepID=A0A7S8C989_9BACI|nr:sigma-70 family RNA polymerase sigma factor [Mangrovibacillus cuniculi]QPC45568.1 sigma-70 family RNA polymerase sigma factor [Mangrovibacillus cuniculi]
MEPFTELAENYTNMIHKVIHTLRIYQHHEEYYQIGLIALWEAHERFEDDKGDFAPYAYSYIKGKMLHELNRKVRDGERYVAPNEDYWAVVADSHPSGALEMEMLLSHCGSLNEKQKKWVQYTFFHMLTLSEIAKVENVSESAVKKWRKGAKEKLRQLKLE